MENHSSIVYQSERLYVKYDGKYRHVTTPEVFEKMGLHWNWKERKFIDIMEIMANLGKPITEWPETNEPELKEPRQMAVLGTCLPGCESMMKDLGFTHAYGNRLGWPNYDECERLGMKVFVNLRDEFQTEAQTKKRIALYEQIRNAITMTLPFQRTQLLGWPSFQRKMLTYRQMQQKAVPTKKQIQSAVANWKDRPVCGGYWSDSVGGHEPDITNQPPSDIQRWLDQRKRFYDTIRSIDSDVINHPVMEMFDCTEYDDFAGHPYPGWKLAYSNETHDLLIVDIYCYAETDGPMKKEITTLFRKLVKPYAHTHQVVPQINAIKYRPGSIWCAYDTWKELLNSDEFENPYRSAKVSLAYYKDETVRKDGAMQVEIKAVNKEIMNV